MSYLDVREWYEDPEEDDDRQTFALGDKVRHVIYPELGIGVITNRDIDSDIEVHFNSGFQWCNEENLILA